MGKVKDWAQYKLERWQLFWLGPTDPIRIDTLRVFIGCSMLLYFGDWWHHSQEWLTPLGYHVSAKLMDIPVPPLLSPTILPWFGILFFGSQILWIIGWKTRWVSWVLLSCIVYVSFVDYLAAYTINRMFITILICLGLVEQGIYWSVDNRRTKVRFISVWPVRILQLYLIVFYFFCGWMKAVHGDWLKNPLILWAHMQCNYRTDFAAWLLGIFPPKAWTWLQYSVLSFELLAPLLFTMKRLRPLGFLWGSAFHLGISLTMYMVGYFSFQMLCLYILFCDDRVLHAMRRLVLQNFYNTERL